MKPIHKHLLDLTRRQFFGASGIRLGGLAAAMLAGRGLTAAEAKTAERVHPPLDGFPHFPPKAKAVIYLHMNGGPSQLDTLDYKPKLIDHFDKDLPDSVRKGQRITTMTSGQARFPVAPSMFKFSQQGKCGMWVSELLPHTAKIVDDIALVKTVHTNAINHDPACTFVMTGSEVPGKPSIGSWLAYGLGSESNDLPAFVVFTPYWSSGAAAQALFTRMWSSGFLPAQVQRRRPPRRRRPGPLRAEPRRRERRATAAPCSTRSDNSTARRSTRSAIPRRRRASRSTRWRSACRRSVPELIDLSKRARNRCWTATARRCGSPARSPPAPCWPAGWWSGASAPCRSCTAAGTSTATFRASIRSQCHDTDQPTAALLARPEATGLLDEHAGGLGRRVRPHRLSPGRLTKTNYGRDHHPRNFCMWLAGGGIKGGQVYGETDDFSYNIDKDPAPRQRPERDHSPLPRHRPHEVHASSSRASTNVSPASRNNTRFENCWDE